LKLNNKKEEKMETDYKGFRVSYEEFNNSWKGVNGDIEFNAWDGLASLKKKIDTHLKKESKFKNMTAIDTGSWGDKGFRKITITSITDDGEAWIKSDGSGREKKSAYSDIYTDNEKNWAVISEIKNKEAAITEIQSEIKELKEALIKLDIPKYK
jgi:hypothetical protein